MKKHIHYLRAVFAVTMSLAGDDVSAAEPKDVGRSLDKIEKHIAEWGHASISSFVLVADRKGTNGSGTNGFFNLNHDVPTAGYVAAIRTNLQGQAAFLEQRETSFDGKGRIANAVPGLNVQGPPEPLNAQQQAALKRQDEQDDLVHQIRMAQLQREYTRITNSTDGWQTNQITIPAIPAAQASTPGGPSNRVPELSQFSLGSNSSSVITGGFSGLGRLATAPSNNQLSESTILKLAATTKVNERVINFMSHPVDLGENQKAFFAIGQISVMPGWRTKQDYICEVSARFDLAGTTNNIVDKAMRNADVLSEGSETLQSPLATALQSFRANPSVEANKQQARTQLTDLFKNAFQNIGAQGRLFATDAAVAKTGIPKRKGFSIVSAFPFMEAQVFDLQNSYRSRLNFLLNLAAIYVQNGYKADAEVMFKHIRQIEKDISTRTAFPTVIPGVDPDMVTYRFDPESTAMIDPTSKKPKAGNQLFPTTIPVLLLFVGSTKDWHLWPEFAVHIETRWIPREDRNIYKTVMDGILHQRFVDKRMSHKKEMELAKALYGARCWLEGEPNPISNDKFKDCDGLYRGMLERKIRFLDNLGWGKTTFIELPALAIKDEPMKAPQQAEANCADRPPIVITSISPNNGFINGTTIFTVRGENFMPVANIVTKVVKSVVPNDEIQTVTIVEKQESYNDPVQFVTVGGRPAVVRVISDKMLQFEVSAWPQGTSFTNKENPADVVFASKCQATNAAKTVWFDQTFPEPTTPQSTATESQKAVDKQAKAIKALMEVDTNLTSKLTGTLQIEAGTSTTGDTNAGPGSSSTVINVQTGQNSNSAK